MSIAGAWGAGERTEAACLLIAEDGPRTLATTPVGTNLITGERGGWSLTLGRHEVAVFETRVG